MNHRFPVRVYYEDTDLAGIVYHANYLKFFERGRSEWLRDLGIDQIALAEGEAGFYFAVRRMAIDFDRPARFDDALEVETDNQGGTGARILLRQTLWRGETKLSHADVTIVAVGKDGRPKRLPETLRALLEGAHTVDMSKF